MPRRIRTRKPEAIAVKRPVAIKLSPKVRKLESISNHERDPDGRDPYKLLGIRRIHSIPLHLSEITWDLKEGYRTCPILPSPAVTISPLIRLQKLCQLRSRRKQNASKY